MSKIANNSVDSRWTYWLSCASASNLADKMTTPINLTYFDSYAIPNGTSSELKLPNYTGLVKVSTLHFEIDYKTKSHTFLDTGKTITITGTILNVVGLTSPIITVNGVIVVNNTVGNISVGVSKITITTTTKFNITNGNIFKNSTNFSDSPISLFAASSYTFTKDEIELLHNGGLYKPLQLPIPENKLSCCFQGNASAYLEAPVDSRFSFTDGINDKSCWWFFEVSNYNSNTLISKDLLNNREWSITTNSTTRQLLLFIFTNSTNYINITFSNIPFTLTKYLLYYNGVGGSNAGLGVQLFINNVENTNRGITPTGTYTKMTATSSVFKIGGGLSGFINTNDSIFNVKVGQSTLTSQDITDIFNNQNIGTEIEHWPISESGGNIRYGRINGINLTLKGTTDGNYNVGYQNVYDYNSQVGGCTKINYFNGGSILGNSPYLFGVSGGNYLINSNIGAYAFRINGCTVISDNQIFRSLTPNLANGSILFNWSANSNKVSVLIGGTYIPFNGTNNTLNVPLSIFNDGSYHSCVVWFDSNNLYLVIDGIYYGYTTSVSIVQFQMLCYNNNSMPKGVFSDLRFWDGITLTQAEAQAYHLNGSMSTPTHAYLLLGNNPGKDLIGTLDLTKGIDLAEYTIPNKIDNTCVLTTYQPVTPSNPISIKRNQIREVLSLGIKNGVINERYGTIANNINSVQVFNGDVQPAMYFNGNNYLDLGNILNAEMKDGFIITCWHKQLGNFNRGTNDLGLISKYASPLGFYTVDDYTLVHTTAKTPTVTQRGLKNTPCLSVFMAYKEKTHIYGFTNELKFKTTIETNFFIQDLTQNLLVGRGLSTATNPNYVGLIYELKILTGGLFNQQEVYQKWASEKNKYGL